MHLLTERFVFLVGGDWGFLKEGVKTYLIEPLSPLCPPTFLSSHLLSTFKPGHVTGYKLTTKKTLLIACKHHGDLN